MRHDEPHTRPLHDRSPQVQALVRAMAARLTTPASLAINARWRARRLTSVARPSAPATPPPTVPTLTGLELATRERQAVQALHEAGRPCGASTCDRPECGP